MATRDRAHRWLSVALLSAALCVRHAGGAVPSGTVTTAVTPGPLVLPLQTGLQEFPNFLTAVTVGPVGEDGQLLCGGVPCPCTTSAAVFKVPPTLKLLSYSPTTAQPTQATLQYELAIPYQNGFPFTHSMTCSISDSGGETFTTASFTVRVNGITWSAPPTSTLVCNEDSTCTFSLITDLNDNIGGTARFTTDWYTITSTDPRFSTSVFFDALPTLTATPVTGCTACTSDITMTLKPDVNTVGTWAGKTGPIPLTVVVKDSLGNKAFARQVTLTVNAVNDAPTATVTSPIVATYGAGTYHFSSVVQNVVLGPATATDETADTLVALQTCTSSKPAVFQGNIELRFDAVPAGSLTFSTVAGLRGHPGWEDFPGMQPLSILITCPITDNGGATSNLLPITLTLNPPNTPPTVTCTSGCDKTLAEGAAAAAFADMYTAYPSTPVGFAAEAAQVMDLSKTSCTEVSNTCVSTTGACVTAYSVTQGTAREKFSVSLTLVAFAVGKTNFKCSFTDSDGAVTDITSSLTVTEVNQPPEATVAVAPQLSSFYSDATQQTVANFLSNVRVAPAAARSEDGQTLCGGAACTCVVSDTAMFATLPVLTLSSYTPTATTPATASLTYSFAAGLPATERLSTVTCTVSDSLGARTVLPSFSITATANPTWSTSSNTISCVEDSSLAAATQAQGWCRIRDYLTGLVDNNAGATQFANVNCPAPCSPSVNPCPPSTTVGGGGGATLPAQCWYVITSSDPRFHNTSFLQVRPYFITAPVGCTAAKPCVSDVALQLGSNENTDGTPLPLTITLQDVNGAKSSRDVQVVVTPVNDKPVFKQASGGIALEASTVAQTVPFLHDLRVGPFGALDEDGQSLTATCTSTNAGLFTAAPSPSFDGGNTAPTNGNPATLSLKFTLASVSTFPQISDVTCTVRDNLGASVATPAYRITVNAGPLTWKVSSTAVSCDEDNSAAPATTATTCTIPNLVTDLNDNRGGTATFNTGCATTADCWYVLASTDSRWATMFATVPTFSNLAGSCTTCSSTMSFKLKDNFNTGGNPVPFTMYIQDSTGVKGAEKSLSLSVPAVNDLPLADGGKDITVAFAATEFVFAKHFENITAGPATAADETSQSVAKGSCVSAPDTGAFVSMALDVAAGAATFRFKLADVNGFPKTENINCEIEDAGGAKLLKSFKVVVSDGPLHFVTSNSQLSVFEDNNALPSLTATQSVFTNFVTVTDSASLGLGNFNLTSTWYTITPSNPAAFATAPALGTPTCGPGSCKADLTFTLANNFFANGITLKVTLFSKTGFPSAVKTVNLEVLAVNDYPTATMTALRDQSITWTDTTDKVVSLFLTGVTAGPLEPTQTLSAVCTNNLNNMFRVQPTLLLTQGSTDTALRYALAGSIKGDATVNCVLKDSANAQLALQSFKVSAAIIPTMAVVSVLTCSEDGVPTMTDVSLLPCRHTDFVTFLNDNNGGVDRFDTAGCPTSSTCWYEFSSDNPAWPTLFKEPPTLTPPTLPCTGQCKADLQYRLADNQNAGGGAVVFGVVVKNSNQVRSATKYTTLTIPRVNDAPTADHPGTVVPNGLTNANTVKAFFTNMKPGPTPDEANQKFTGSCVGWPSNFFTANPTITIDENAKTGDLFYSLTSSAPHQEAYINCTLTDDGAGASQGPAARKLEPIKVLTVLSWDLVTDMYCYEDGSEKPQVSTQAPTRDCYIRRFISNLNDNNDGASTFPPDWVTISSTDPRWYAGSDTVVHTSAIVGTPQYCKGTCTVDLRIVPKGDLNTAIGGPIMLNVTVKDAANRALTKMTRLNIVLVNDYPVVSHPVAVLRALANDTTEQSRPMVGTVAVGPPTAIDERGEKLCDNGVCDCVATPNIFKTPPRLSLTRIDPDPAGTPAEGNLLFTLQDNLQGIPKSRVNCTIRETTGRTGQGRPLQLLEVYVSTVVETYWLAGDAKCPPYFFDRSVVPAQHKPCVNGTSLSAVYEPTCFMDCEEGYSRLTAPETFEVKCPRIISPPLCGRTTCHLGPIVPANASYQGCNTLKTGDWCNPVCDSGFHKFSPPFELLCEGAGLTQHKYADAFTDCQENQCFVSLPKPLIPGDVDPCTNGLLLSTRTDTSCQVKCDYGYITSGDTNVTCVPNAAHLSTAQTAPTVACAPTCLLFSGCEARGGVYKDEPGTIKCIGQCTYDRCCNSLCGSFTGCDGGAGLVLKDEPALINCNTSACSTDVCCDTTCAITNFTLCTTKGYIPRLPAEVLRCPPATEGGCDAATCCIATCDNADFTSCTHGYFVKKLNQATIPCKGHIASRDCDIDTCCRPTCYNSAVSCRTGLVKKVDAHTIVCGPSGCTEEQCCDTLCTTSGFACPTPFVMKPDAAMLRCNNNLHTSCSKETCCEVPCQNVVCLPSDECHLPGACVANVCTNPPKPDGTVCSAGFCRSGNCVADQSCQGTPCTVSACVSATCLGNVCIPLARPAGTTCNDNDDTTQNDICMHGVCCGVKKCHMKSCPAPTPCRQQGVCDPRTGACTSALMPDGSVCDDGDAMTWDDKCAGGVCTGKWKCGGRHCPHMECHIMGSCDVNRELCVYTQQPDGAKCTTTTVSVGRCLSGSCVDSTCNCIACGPCKVSHCNTGACQESNKPDGTRCLISGADSGTCRTGVCLPEDKCVGVVCPVHSTKCFGPSLCVAATGKCDNPLPVLDGTPCDDGLEMTILDVCKRGVCQGTPKCTSVTCPTVQCQSKGLCNDATGSCDFRYSPNGMACDDSIPVTTDRCSYGMCVGSIECGAETCLADPCRIPICVNGMCSDTLADDGTPCQNGLGVCSCGNCMVADTCVGVVCKASSQCHTTIGCIYGSCLEAPVPDNTPCDDGDVNTQGDVCIAGVCRPQNSCHCPVSECTTTGACGPYESFCNVRAINDGVQCNGGAGRCVRGDCIAIAQCAGVSYTPQQCHAAHCRNGEFAEFCLPLGTVCSDANHRTINDTCQATPTGLACIGIDLCAGVVCHPLSQCHLPGRCNVLTGRCDPIRKADGLACDDNDATTATDVCRGGVCSGTSKCAACAKLACGCEPECEPTTGKCIRRTLPDGTACDDGNAKTSADVCVAGSCIGEVTCESSVCRVSKACHLPVCVSGRCTESMMPDGTLCSGSGNYTQQPTCRNGLCQSPTYACELAPLPPCPAQDQCHEEGACEVSNGLRGCTQPAKPNYTPCDDSNAATSGDVCVEGVCVGSPLCSAECPHVGHCQTGLGCNATTGVCEVDTLTLNGTLCIDGDPFTVNDTCIMGSCLGALACGNASCYPSSQCHKAKCGTEPNTCAEFILTAHPCDDANSSTTGDACDAFGRCVGAPLCAGVDCPVTNVCVNTSWCDPLRGACTDMPKLDGTPCANGSVTEEFGVCRRGLCVSTRCDNVNCNTPSDDCHLPGTCSPLTGECTYPIKPGGSLCEDGSVDTIRDACTNGVCTGQDACAGITCTPISECYTAGTCKRGICTTPAKPDHTPCLKGAGTCQTGKCVVVDLCKDVVCAASDACHTAGVCNNSTGLCTDPAVEDGRFCNDGYAETTGDRCLSGVCIGTVMCNGMACQSQDGCHVAFCSSTTCTQVAFDGTKCNDGNILTVNDTCLSGVCTGKGRCDNVVCETTDLCKTTNVCNPATGKCEWVPTADATRCDDRNDATVNDQCLGGVCKGEVPCSRPCAPPARCYVNAPCNTQTGLCSALMLEDDTACSDGNANTQNDRCAKGVCVGTLLCNGVTPCNSTNPCQRPTCSGDRCVLANYPDGTLCTDHVAQTKNDKCVAGICVGEAFCDIVCTAVSQCHTAGECNPVSGLCDTPLKQDNTPCDDGDAKTLNDKCVAGRCLGTSKCSNVICGVSDQCHLKGVCDEETGLCSDPLMPDNTPCNDANVQTTNDVCLAGACVGSISCGNTFCYSDEQCSNPQCTGGVCSTLFKATNAPCNDGNSSTFTDLCREGVCRGTDRCAGVVCQARMCYEAMCEPLTGECSYLSAPMYTPCEDGNALTFNDHCSLGVCAGTSRCENVTCPSRGQCHNAGVCDPSTGQCQYPSMPDGKSCDDGNALTTVDVCLAGICSGSLPCGATSCTPGACAVARCVDDKCSTAYLPDGTVCDDRNSSTHGDSCNSGVCTGRDLCAGVVCKPSSTCHIAGLCEPSTGKCTDPVKPNGSPCDDKLANTRDDQCTKGVCTGTANCEGVTCAPRVACRGIGVCDVTHGLCTEPVLKDGTPCDDNNTASVDDVCMAGVCVGTITCGSTKCAATGDCMVSYCNTDAGLCREVHKADGTPCSDNNPLTTDDACLAGVCTPRDLCVGVTCTGDGKCLGAGVCDPLTGRCSTSMKPDNSICNDGNPETSGDRCQNGICAGVGKCEDVNCGIATQCTVANACDLNTGLCVVTIKEDGTACNDGKVDTANDKCQAGTCLGEITCGLSVCRPRGQCYESQCRTGACHEVAKADGMPCDDHDANTAYDICIGGTCSGQDSCAGVSCNVTDSCHMEGVCTRGTCLSRLQPDGTACNDSLAQTAQDKCMSGVCVGDVQCGGTPCVPVDPQCHYAVCNGTVCAELAKPDLTPCNDGTGNNVFSRCVAGLCVDTNPCRSVTCVALSQCHDPGTCTKGVCSNPVKPGNMPCDDLDPKTTRDLCFDGVCRGTPKCQGVACSASDQCHDRGECNEVTGLCTDPKRADGTTCLKTETTGKCVDGVCVGSITCGGQPCTPPAACKSTACDGSSCAVLNLDGGICNDGIETTTGDRCTDGTCIGKDICIGVTCPADTQCHLHNCIAGRCEVAMKANNTVCDDGNSLTANDRCQNGVCVGQNPCEIGQCGSQCVGIPDGTACDDGRAASINDRCIANVCVGTFMCAGVLCATQDDCHAPGVCDVLTGKCSNPELPDGTSCNDGDPTTLDDVCTGAVCIGTVTCGGKCGRPPACTWSFCTRDNACRTRPQYPHTPCDDRVAATVADFCEKGTCRGRNLCEGVVCPEGQCLEGDRCDSSTGACREVPKADGTECNGGLCAAGACISTVPCGGATCTASGPCEIVSCVNDACVRNPMPNHHRCNDGKPRTLRDQCIDGTCVGVDLCSGVVCAYDQCHQMGVCNPRTGICSEPLLKEGTKCNDETPTTDEDMCMAGGCVGIVTCGHQRCYPTEPHCKVATCVNGDCSESNAPDGIPCNDNNPLTLADTCKSGVCVGIDRCLGVVCTSESTCMDSLGCDARTGACVLIPKEDRNVCVEPISKMNGLCMSGSCVPRVECGGVVCTTADPRCRQPICEANVCKDVIKFDGTQCDDGNATTVNDVCKAGVCGGRAPCDGVACASPDQCQESLTCHPQSGLCMPRLRAPASPCNDGNPETTEDRCESGACRGNLVCGGVQCIADRPQCFTVTCQADRCVQKAKPIGTLCNDGLENTFGDKCNDDGVCAGVDRCANVQCTASSQCHFAGVCDVFTGICTEVAKPDGTACLEGTCMAGACSQATSCATNQTCLPLTPQCHFASCDGVACKRDNRKPEGTPCNDGNPATFDDRCRNGVCTGSDKCAGVSCVSQGRCREDGMCEPSTGLCTHSYSPDGMRCNDTNPFTVQDSCRAGVCRGVRPCTTTVCVPEDPRCSVSTCVNGKCGEEWKYDGTPCSDNDPSTFDDQCLKGKCVGVDRCKDVKCQPDNTNSAPCYSQGVCNPQDGLCSYAQLSDETKCETDGQCENGVCVHSVTCGSTACPKNGACTLYACSKSGACEVTNKPDGQPCNDMVAATVRDVCRAGVCQGVNLCEGITCAAASGCRLAGACEPSTGKCVHEKRPETTLCDDGNPQSHSDACAGGQCVGITPCGGQICRPTSNVCRQVICENDACREIMLNDIPCDDNDEQTVNDRCYVGTCVGPNLCAGVTCKPRSVCHLAGQCNPANGLCTNPIAHFAAPCDDGDASTEGQDTCANGVCSGTRLCNLPGSLEQVACYSPDACTIAGCNVTGCTYQRRPTGTSCDDGDEATTDDVCVDGTCKGINKCAGKVCNAASECHYQGICMAETGQCTSPKRENGTLCNGGKCFIGSCVADVVCAGKTCQVGDPRCQESECFAGLCRVKDKPEGTLCDDNDETTLRDKCTQGVCTGTAAACDIRNCPEQQCKLTTGCDVLGVCTYKDLVDGTPCDDSSPTTADFCRGGVCVGEAHCGSYRCRTTDQCRTSICTSQVCDEVSRADGVICSDGNSLTFDDKCLDGACVGKDRCDGVSCGLVDQCHGEGTCDSRTGQCNYPRKDQGTTCNDGEVMSADDQCVAGVCVGIVTCGTVRCPLPSGPCKKLVCNADSCTEINKPENTTCTDERAETEGDRCIDGTCTGFAPTCGNGTLRHDSSAAACKLRADADAIFCPSGVCDSATCCASCATFDASLCACKGLVLNALEVRCPPEGCTTDTCCDPGMATVDIKLTANRPGSRLVLLQDNIAQRVAGYLGIPVPQITNIRVNDFGAQQGRVDLTAQKRPTYSMPTSAKFSELAQQVLTRELPRMGIDFGVNSALVGGSLVQVNSTVALVNVTLEVPALHITTRRKEFVTAVSKATGVPESLIVGVKVVEAFSASRITVQFTARPCGASNEETSQYISAMLQKDKLRAGNGILTTAGFPFVSHSTTGTITTIVATVSMVVRANNPGVFPSAATAFANAAGATLVRSCSAPLPEALTHRLEVTMSAVSDTWTPTGFSHVLRKSVRSQASSVNGVFVDQTQAEPTVGDCMTAPCGCGQRCSDPDGRADGVFSCQCRYPYESGSGQSAPALCNGNELKLLVAAAQDPLRSKETVAANLLTAIKGIAGRDEMYGDGLWFNDALTVADSVAETAGLSRAVEASLLGSVDSMLQQRSILWLQCCTTAAKAHFPATCCGDVIDENSMRAFNTRAAAMVSNLAAKAAPAAGEYVGLCDSSGCVSDREDDVVNRREAAAAGRQYLSVLHGMAEQMCTTQAAGKVVFTTSSTTFDVHALVLGKGDTALADEKTVQIRGVTLRFKQQQRGREVCRSVVASLDKTGLEGTGYPHLTPVGDRVSLRYAKVIEDTGEAALSVRYIVGLERAKAVSDSNYYTLAQWDAAATNWVPRPAITQIEGPAVAGDFTGEAAVVVPQARSAAAAVVVPQARSAAVLAVPASEKLVVLGIAEYERPDRDCFACVALPIVWAVAVIMVTVGLVWHFCCRGTPSDAPPVVPRWKKFFLHHVWARCCMHTTVGYEQSPFHKSTMVAFALVFAWCFVCVFFENESENYEWSVEVGNGEWLAWGFIVGVLTTGIVALFDLSVCTVNAGAAVAGVVHATKVLVLAGVTVLMALHTSEYNTWAQREEYVYAFLVALLSHVLLFESLRALLMYAIGVVLLVSPPLFAKLASEPTHPTLLHHTTGLFGTAGLRAAGARRAASTRRWTPMLLKCMFTFAHQPLIAPHNPAGRNVPPSRPWAKCCRSSRPRGSTAATTSSTRRP